MNAPFPNPPQPSTRQPVFNLPAVVTGLIVVLVAIQAGRNIKVLHHLSQPPDHPVSIFHPEGEYLKGLVLYVE